MYHRKAGCAIAMEEDPDDDQEEDSDLELVKALEDGKLKLGKQVISTLLVKKGKRKVSEVVATQTTAKQRPTRSEQWILNPQAPSKESCMIPDSEVRELHWGEEHLEALLDTVSATGTDVDGIPYSLPRPQSTSHFVMHQVSHQSQGINWRHQSG
jgi:hypothetical protein